MDAQLIKLYEKSILSKGAQDETSRFPPLNYTKYSFCIIIPIQNYPSLFL